MAETADSDEAGRLARMQESLETVVGGETPPQPSGPTPLKIGNVAASLGNATKFDATSAKTVDDTFDHNTAFRFAFCGAGQGGGRLVDAFWRLGYRRAVAFNTTESDFNGLSPAMYKHSLNIGGAGKDMERGRQALLGHEEEVRDLFIRGWGSNVDYGFICAGLGGGTGSGTVVELVKLARKYLKDQSRLGKVGAIVSLPTRTEGYQVCRNAVLALKALVALKVSPLLIIDNARIVQIHKPALTQMYPAINNAVSRLFHIFNQLAAVHSQFVTFDRAEFGQLLDSGLVVMGSADIQKISTPADISGAIREKLAGGMLAQIPLVNNGDKAACLFVGHSDILDRMTMDYFDAGFTQMGRILSSDESKPTVVHRGVYLGDSPGLQAYVMLGGLSLPVALLEELAKVGGLCDAAAVSKRGLAGHLGIDDTATDSK